MNKGARKVQEMVRRTNLRNDKVDGHLATRGMSEDFEVGEGGTSSKILELLDSAAAGKVRLELWNDVMEMGYPRRNYLQDKTDKGKSDLSLCRIREIRGWSGRYGNCSHGNQGIVQVI